MPRRFVSRARRLGRRLRERRSAAALLRASQAGVVVASVVLLSARGVHRLRTPLLAAAVLVCGTFAEGTVHGLATRPLPTSFGLPGVRDGSVDRPFSGPAWGGVSGAGTIGFALLAVVDAGPAGFAVVAVAPLVLWLVLSRGALRGELHRRRLLNALRSYAPQLAMPYAAKSGGPWQLRMWEPYLVRSGLRLVVFNTLPQYLDVLRQAVTVPLVQIPGTSPQELDPLVVPSLRAFFYVQNASLNSAYLRYDHITHVWLGHGDSDKPASASRFHARYDLLVVSGQAAIDRYAASGVLLPREKFVVVGRPQLSGIRPSTTPISAIPQPVVMYAPTWKGKRAEVDFSSLPIAPLIVTALLNRGVTVLFRPHPLSAQWAAGRAMIRAVHKLLRTDADRTGRRHVFGDLAEKDWSLVDCMNHCHALISDVSSVVSDFLQSGKPYAMVSMHAEAETFRAQIPSARAGYVLTPDLAGVDQVLDDLLERDPLRHARQELKRYVLGGFTGEESAATFARLVRRVGEAPTRTTPP